MQRINRSTHRGIQQHVCLIRHGESNAQGTSRAERKNEAIFTDCECSNKGISQAYAIPDLIRAHGGLAAVDLVVTSPLTRALTTALLAFRDRPDCRIVVSPFCRELDDYRHGMPENKARSVKELRRVI